MVLIRKFTSIHYVHVPDLCLIQELEVTSAMVWFFPEPSRFEEKVSIGELKAPLEVGAEKYASNPTHLVPEWGFFIVNLDWGYSYRIGKVLWG